MRTPDPTGGGTQENPATDKKEADDGTWSDPSGVRRPGCLISLYQKLIYTQIATQEVLQADDGTDSDAHPRQNSGAAPAIQAKTQ